MKLDPASLQPLLAFAAQLDLDQPDAARNALAAEFPLDSAPIQALRAHMIEEMNEGRLVHNGKDPLRYSRVFKQSEETLNFSSDAVLMNGAGPKHRHPEGEIDLCFALEGDPKFDGNPEGWVVYGKGSVHIPTVSGGQMLILYLLPNGAFEFVKA
jgi:hypothetical protein